MPTIETERLILRDFVPSDWDALNAFLSDPAVIRFMHFASWDEGKRREWLTSVIQRASNRSVKLTQTWTSHIQRSLPASSGAVSLAVASEPELLCPQA